MKDPTGSLKSGAIASLTIDCQDFGVAWYMNLDEGVVLVNNEVEIVISLELIKNCGVCDGTHR